MGIGEIIELKVCNSRNVVSGLEKYWLIFHKRKKYTIYVQNS
jgi:hypothetical protein